MLRIQYKIIYTLTKLPHQQQHVTRSRVTCHFRNKTWYV